MRKFGIQTSIGIDVIKAVSRNKSFNSQENYLKSFMQGVAAVKVTGAGIFSTDITHNLGYQPVFIHLGAADPVNPARRSLGRSAASGPGGTIGIDSHMTKEKLTMAWQEGTIPTRTYPFYVTFYYYIFYNSLI